MGITDNSGNLHTSAGQSGAGQFANKNNSAPSGHLAVTDGAFLDSDASARSAARTLLWASSEVEEWQMDHDDVDVSLSDESQKWLQAELDDFAEAYPELIAEARATGYTSVEGDGFDGVFGHDFVLTRNHEGVGFWDRKELEANNIGRRLTDAVQKRSEITDYLFVDDDGVANIDNGYAQEQQRQIESHLKFAEAVGKVNHKAVREELTKDGSYDYLSYRVQARFDQDD